MLDIISHVWSAFNALPPEVLNQLSQILLTAVVASPLFLVIRQFVIKEREKLMALVVIVGSVAAGASIFLATMPHTGVWVEYTGLIALIQGIITYATTQPVWIYVVKPLWLRGNVWLQAQIAEAAKLNEVKTAAIDSMAK